MPTQSNIVAIGCREVLRELVNYAEGELMSELRVRIEAHLTSCRHCVAIYDGAGNIVRLLGDNAVLELPIGFSLRLRQKLAFQSAARLS